MVWRRQQNFKNWWSWDTFVRGSRTQGIGTRPQLADLETALIYNKVVMKTEIEFLKINYHFATTYIAICMTGNEQALMKILPRRNVRNKTWSNLYTNKWHHQGVCQGWEEDVCYNHDEHLSLWIQRGWYCNLFGWMTLPGNVVHLKRLWLPRT